MSARTFLQGVCVALDGRAALILGPPGSGKSALAIEMLALGATLVADDLVHLRRENDRLIAAAPPRAPAAIEARGLGLLPVPLTGETPVFVAARVDRAAEARLPPRRRTRLLGAELPLVFQPSAAALTLCLRYGAPLDPDAKRQD
jgi:HPr kinase/phosphorylase